METKSSKTENRSDRGSSIIRCLRKQDILDLLQYEKETGYHFNRMPNHAFIYAIAEDSIFPISYAMVHNGIEMRCDILADQKHPIRIFMPFKTFFGLPQFNGATNDIVESPSMPNNVPDSILHKGITIHRYLSESDIKRLKSNHLMANTAPELRCRIKTISVQNVNHLSFYTDGTDYSSILGNIPVDQYFLLESKVESWPVWKR